jgi:hypothetical protein
MSKKRTKVPVVTEPPKPQPPPTRAQVEDMFRTVLESEVTFAKGKVEDWMTTFAKETLPGAIVSRLEWSQGFIEEACKHYVYNEVYAALAAPDSKATLDSLYEYILDKTIDGGRWPPHSTSPTSNTVDTAKLQAWASLACSTRQFVRSAQRADEIYGRDPKVVGPSDDPT